MQLRKDWLRSTLLVMSLGALACGEEDDSRARALSQLGFGCSTDADCVSGICTELSIEGSFGICSLGCRSDKDCPAKNDGQRFSCGVAVGQERLCLPDCKLGGAYGGNLVCVDEITTSCAAAPDSACRSCGCKNSNEQYCVTDVGCVNLKEVGEPCQSSYECSSHSCSPTAKLCRVPTGAPCTSANCDMCLTTNSGYSFCSKACTSQSECPGQRCIGSGGGFTFEASYTCRPPCDASCPGTCELSSGGSQIQFCSCSGCFTAP